MHSEGFNDCFKSAFPDDQRRPVSAGPDFAPFWSFAAATPIIILGWFCHNRLGNSRESSLTGNRKAFKQAIIAYLCIGGLLGLCVAFYGTSSGREINEIIALSILAIYAGASLIAIVLTWRCIKKGEPFRPMHPHYLLPKKYRRWMVGESDTDSDR